MSIHIGAEKEEIAETVLISGDPLRAKYISDHMLTDSKCYTEVRNMLGYTGSFNGHRVSVQGTGMGQASLAIYVHELIREYGVKKIIRVGTCGALMKEIMLGEVIIAQGACTDGTANRMLFNGLDYAPMADFALLHAAYESSLKKDVAVRVGNVFSTDLFYSRHDPQRWAIWREHQLLCADMETSMLYTMSAGSGVQALSILTVSDNIVTNLSSSAHEREKSFTDMTKIALSIL